MSMLKFASRRAKDIRRGSSRLAATAGQDPDMLPGQPSVRQRAARRVDGAFDPVLSEARNLLQAAIPHAKKKLRRLRSVREAGALLASSAIEIGARFGPAGRWHKRACTACNLKRLHSVVAELLKAAGSGNLLPPARTKGASTYLS